MSNKHTKKISKKKKFFFFFEESKRHTASTKSAEPKEEQRQNAIFLDKETARLCFATERSVKMEKNVNTLNSERTVYAQSTNTREREEKKK